MQFYTINSGWINSFRRNDRRLHDGDTMTISLKNEELRYAVNDIDLGGMIKVDMTNKKELYLFVHTRNNKSKVEILYICELLN